MSINKPEMSMHLRIMHTLFRISNELGKHLKVTYKKKQFKNSYRGKYFTHYYEIYLNKKYVCNVYGDMILSEYYMKDKIREKLVIVCRLRRKRNVKKYVRF